jgi:uncharacterized protein
MPLVIDAHLHCTGRENDRQVLQALDEAAIDIGVLLAPFLSDGYSLQDGDSLRRANDHLAALVRGHRDRLVGFAVVNPALPGARDELRRAIDAGLSGAKMVPSGWYPYDEHVQPVFAEAASLELPLLFHSGIFIDGRSSRFCRPTFFEALRDHPGVRVALAHLGWPWTDESIALGLIDRIHGVPDERAAFRFDVSFGPPPPYRLEVLKRALEILGPGLLQFGSDCFFPCSGAEIAERRGWLAELMDALELDDAARAQIWSGTAAAWLGRAVDGPLDTSRVRTDEASATSGAPGASAASNHAGHRRTPAAAGTAGRGNGLFSCLRGNEGAAAPYPSASHTAPSARWTPLCC